MEGFYKYTGMPRQGHEGLGSFSFACLFAKLKNRSRALCQWHNEPACVAAVPAMARPGAQKQN